MTIALARQFAVFTLAGAVATLADYTLLIMLVQVFRADPVLASVGGCILGALVGYVLNYTVTFKSKKRHQEALSKFLTIAAIGLGLNTMIMSVLTNSLQVHYLLSQVIATSIVLLWNFIANKWWTFKENSSARN